MATSPSTDQRPRRSREGRRVLALTLDATPTGARGPGRSTLDARPASWATTRAAQEQIDRPAKITRTH